MTIVLDKFFLPKKKPQKLVWNFFVNYFSNHSCNRLLILFEGIYILISFSSLIALLNNHCINSDNAHVSSSMFTPFFFSAKV